MLQNIKLLIALHKKILLIAFIDQNSKILSLLFFNLLIFTNLQNYNLQTIHWSNKIFFVYCLLYSLGIKKCMYIQKLIP